MSSTQSTSDRRFQFLTDTVTFDVTIPFEDASPNMHDTLTATHPDAAELLDKVADATMINDPSARHAALQEALGPFDETADFYEILKNIIDHRKENEEAYSEAHADTDMTVNRDGTLSPPSTQFTPLFAPPPRSRSLSPDNAFSMGRLPVQTIVLNPTEPDQLAVITALERTQLALTSTALLYDPSADRDDFEGKPIHLSQDKVLKHVGGELARDLHAARTHWIDRSAESKSSWCAELQADPSVLLRRYVTRARNTLYHAENNRRRTINPMKRGYVRNWDGVVTMETVTDESGRQVLVKWVKVVDTVTEPFVQGLLNDGDSTPYRIPLYPVAEPGPPNQLTLALKNRMHEEDHTLVDTLRRLGDNGMVAEAWRYGLQSHAIDTIQKEIQALEDERRDAMRRKMHSQNRLEAARMQERVTNFERAQNQREARRHPDPSTRSRRNKGKARHVTTAIDTLPATPQDRRSPPPQIPSTSTSTVSSVSSLSTESIGRHGYNWDYYSSVPSYD